MKRFIVLGCAALTRSLQTLAEQSPHTIDIRMYRQGLHDHPKSLHTMLQEAIDTILPGECDAILLAYGICGGTTLNLTARHTPLVLPRAHDCITLYLGSRQRYQEEFDAHPGTYWYSQDYLENNDSGAAVGLGAASSKRAEEVYAQYVEKFGEENAQYLMEVMGEWGQHYDRAVFIDTGTDDGARYEQIARDEAERRGWLFERRQGDRRLIELMLNGNWSEDEFLIVQPGETIIQAGDDGIVRAKPIET